MNFWLEVLKLLVPFMVALSGIWAKEWYVAKRERKILMDFIWRELVSQIELLRTHIESFGKIPDKLKADGFCIFVFQMPETYFSVPQRLAQLDSPNTFIYSNFASMAKHVDASSKSLQNLLNDALRSDETKKDVYFKAVNRHSTGLQRDFLAFAQSCIQLMKAIAPNIKDREQEAIPRAENTLNQTRELMGNNGI